MPWFKVDDRLTFHPKVLSAGTTESQRNEAIGAWVRLGAYCSAHLTDGRLAAAIVIAICGVDTASRLVDCGFLDRADDGTFLMHDYLEYNPSADQIKAGRIATAERVSRYRQRNGVSNTVGNTAPSPIPSHPIPVPYPTHSQPVHAGWLDEVYSKYPRKVNKARGATALEQLSESDRHAFTKAVSAYARQVAAEKTESRWVTTWPVFCEGKWREYVPVEKTNTKAPNIRDFAADPPPPKDAA